MPSLALPSGFIAHTGHAGLRQDEGDDVAVIVSTRPCTSAGVFTQSRFEGPSVTLSRPRATSGRARAIVVVAKNANVATGAQGLRDAEEITAAVAAVVGIPVDEVLIASTGVIGRPYPMDLLRAHLAGLPQAGVRRRRHPCRPGHDDHRHGGQDRRAAGRSGPGGRHGQGGRHDRTRHGHHAGVRADRCRR